MAIYMSNVSSNGGGGPLDYSLQEQNTGIKWYNGKDIYVITGVGEVTNSTMYPNVTTTIDDAEDIIKIDVGMYFTVNKNAWVCRTLHGNSIDGIRERDFADHSSTVSRTNTIPRSEITTTFKMVGQYALIGDKVFHTIYYTKITT